MRSIACEEAVSRTKHGKMRGVTTGLPDPKHRWQYLPAIHPHQTKQLHHRHRQQQQNITVDFTTDDVREFASLLSARPVLSKLRALPNVPLLATGCHARTIPASQSPCRLWPLQRHGRAYKCSPTPFLHEGKWRQCGMRCGSGLWGERTGSSG